MVVVVLSELYRRRRGGGEQKADEERTDADPSAKHPQFIHICVMLSSPPSDTHRPFRVIHPCALVVGTAIG